MRVEDILKLDVGQVLDISKNNPKLLRKYVAQLGAASQKRAARTEAAAKREGYYVPYVVERYQAAGGYRGIRGKTAPQVMTEFQRLRGFLLNKGTTAKGASEYRKEFSEYIASSFGLPSGISYNSASKMLRALDRIRERNPDLFRTIIGSKEVMEMLREEQEFNPKISVDELVDRVQFKLDERYQDEEKHRSDVSEFFNDGSDKWALKYP